MFFFVGKNLKVGAITHKILLKSALPPPTAIPHTKLGVFLLLDTRSLYELF